MEGNRRRCGNRGDYRRESKRNDFAQALTGTLGHTCLFGSQEKTQKGFFGASLRAFTKSALNNPRRLQPRLGQNLGTERRAMQNEASMAGHVSTGNGAAMSVLPIIREPYHTDQEFVSTNNEEKNMSRRTKTRLGNHTKRRSSFPVTSLGSLLTTGKINPVLDTPLPWRTDGEFGHEVILDANGVMVADLCIFHFSRNAEHNQLRAKLICDLVNKKYEMPR